MDEVRKVQRTSSGTFFICIPKPWAERCSLKRGSVVAVSETSDGKLLIDPEYGTEPSPRTITLRPSPYLSREILGKYLLGFDIIRIETEGHIGFEVRESVKRAISQLVGLEIIEEDYSSIVLQCLLEPLSFPPEKILRRGYAIVAGMHRDVVNALINRDAHLAKSVVSRDEEVNRLYFLLVRILRTIIQNPSLGEKLGVKPIECLDYRLTASLVEAIGDECVKAALKVLELKDVTLTEDLRKLLMEFHKTCFESHEMALRAFFAGEISLAENVKGMRERVEGDLTKIERTAKAYTLDVVSRILAITSALKQIYEHSVDIADLVMPKKLVCLRS